MRKIYGLRWARSCLKPTGIPIGRPRGAKASGLRYERALAKVLPSAKHGVWFEFEDLNGLGCCQTDLIFGHEGILWVLEVKYSQTDGAWKQIEDLYIPILKAAFGKPTLGLQVCKNLIPGQAGRVCPTLSEAMETSKVGRRAVWQWLGGEVGSSLLVSRRPVGPRFSESSPESLAPAPLGR